MPENLFLSPSLLADPRTFTWINERSHVLSPPVQPPPAPGAAGRTSEYRKNFLPVYFGRKSRLCNPLTPFSGLTCSLPAYKATRIHPVPPLTPKDPVFQDLLTVEAIQPQPRAAVGSESTAASGSDPRSLLHKFYMRSEYKDNFASVSARGRALKDHHDLVQRCQSAPGGAVRRAPPLRR